jgi:hypothetical protein
MVISMDNLKKIYSSKFVTCFGGDLLLVKQDFLLLSIGTFVTCFGGDLLLVKQDFLLLSIGTLDPSLLPVLEEIYFWLIKNKWKMHLIDHVLFSFSDFRMLDLYGKK